MRDKHGDFEQPDPDVQDSNCSSPKSDYKFNYHQLKLMFGLLLRDFNDTIREGDGEHLIDLYKLALLIYDSEGHTKHAYVVLLHLLKVVAILPPFEAHRLKWNRFYNKYGGRGNNIPLDLKKEQQNKVLKTFWRALGANIDETNAARVAMLWSLLKLLYNRWMQTVSMVDEWDDAQCQIRKRVYGKLWTTLLVKRFFTLQRTERVMPHFHTLMVDLSQTLITVNFTAG